MLKHTLVQLAMLLGLAMALTGAPAAAQVSASVTVNAGSRLGTIPPQAYGINAAVWDGHLMDGGIPTILKNAGCTTLRYPGGSYADIYHWQTNSATAGTGAYINPNDNFDNFMSVVNAMGGSALITVNYGSNAAGTAGGDPNEAAAWVNYSNNTHKYGVKYWEVGNELYGNGEYGAAWEEDLHSAHDPTTYGTNVLTFVSAMKAQDPTIKVGAILCAPGNWPDGLTPNWNENVLTACGSKIDFVIVHWYSQEPGSETDAGLLGDPGQIAGMVSTVRSEINQYCGSNAPNVEILVTETNSVSYNPGKQTVSLVNALFMADDYMDWLEGGVAHVGWWDLHNGASTGNNNSSSLYGPTNYGDYGILAYGGSPEPVANTPFPTYYGLQMLSKLGRPGDSMVAASSDQSLVAAHAVQRANGNLAVMLINKDPGNSYNVTVNIAGYTPDPGGTLYNYGEKSRTISTSSRSGLGTGFTQTILPYSLNTIVMAPVVKLSGLTVTPERAVGGETVCTATATITGPAPAGGVAVTFTSSDLTLHDTVTIPAGSRSASATYTPNPTDKPVDVTVTSTLWSMQKGETIAVEPLPVASLSLSPGTVVGGQSGTGTVTLSDTAKIDTPVSLASTTSAAVVPGSVVVKQGAKSAQFAIRTSTVPATSSAMLAASSGGVKKTARLGITAPAVSALAFSPDSVKGGATSTGMVTLNGKVTAATVVALSSGSSAAAVPASVTVPVGSSSATFTVKTVAVSAKTTAKITAGAPGGAKTADLTITP